ncbi:MAG: P-II family nitrogen regulator [Planctomycetota bacterium]
MKLVIAYIKSHKLPEVTMALRQIKGLTGASVSDARGFGRQRSNQSTEAGDYVPIIRLEIFCNDVLSEMVVSAIEKAAHTGLRGDGKIYVCEVNQAVRISSGERDEKAI